MFKTYQNAFYSSYVKPYLFPIALDDLHVCLFIITNYFTKNHSLETKYFFTNDLLGNFTPKLYRFFYGVGRIHFPARVITSHIFLSGNYGVKIFS